MATERPARLRLFDILDSIHQIELSVHGVSFDTFRHDVLRYRAVERLLEILSEASRHVDDALKMQEPTIEWKQLANFGNVIRHGYEIVDALVIWNIVVHDVPELKAGATRLYEKVKQPADPWPDAQAK